MGGRRVGATESGKEGWQRELAKLARGGREGVREGAWEKREGGGEQSRDEMS